MARKGVSGLVSSTHRLLSSVSVGTNTDISGDLPAVGGLNELNIEGALTDELKLLQVVCVCVCVCVSLISLSSSRMPTDTYTASLRWALSAVQHTPHSLTHTHIRTHTRCRSRNRQCFIWTGRNQSSLLSWLSCNTSRDRSTK